MELYNFESEAVWYVPDYKDNREKPEAEQLAVLITPTSRRDYQRLEERHSSVTRGGKMNFTRRYNKLRAEVIGRCVKEVVNLTLTTMKEGKRDSRAITTGEDLAQCAPDSMLEDIIEAIRDQSLLDEGIRGKSVSQSGSSA